MTSHHGPLRVGIGGPVGSGKTTLTEKLCKALSRRFSIAVVTNDIYTKEDALMLARLQALPEERIVGRRDGRLPAYRDPRGRLDQPAGDRRARAAIPGPRHRLHRIRRRQSRRHVLARPCRPHPLCHFGLPGRGNPAQGRTGHHPLRLSWSSTRADLAPYVDGRPRRNAPRRSADARSPSLRLHRFVARQGR